MKDALRNFSEVGLLLIFMTFVYILQSEQDETKFYFGKTKNLKPRLKSHNTGQSIHTAKYRPWKIIWFGCFVNEKKASNFEKYLKSASGKAFLRKRLI